MATQLVWEQSSYHNEVGETELSNNFSSPKNNAETLDDMLCLAIVGDGAKSQRATVWHSSSRHNCVFATATERLGQTTTTLPTYAQDERERERERERENNIYIDVQG
jgi:hypothetical protein